MQIHRWIHYRYEDEYEDEDEDDVIEVEDHGRAFASLNVGGFNLLEDAFIVQSVNRCVNSGKAASFDAVTSKDFKDDEFLSQLDEARLAASDVQLVRPAGLSSASSLTVVVSENRLVKGSPHTAQEVAVRLKVLQHFNALVRKILRLLDLSNTEKSWSLGYTLQRLNSLIFLDNKKRLLDAVCRATSASIQRIHNTLLR